MLTAVNAISKNPYNCKNFPGEDGPCPPYRRMPMLVPSSTPPSNVPQNNELKNNIFQVVKILIINYYNHNLLVSEYCYKI